MTDYADRFPPSRNGDTHRPYQAASSRYDAGAFRQVGSSGLYLPALRCVRGGREIFSGLDFSAPAGVRNGRSDSRPLSCNCYLLLMAFLQWPGAGAGEP